MRAPGALACVVLAPLAAGCTFATDTPPYVAPALPPLQASVTTDPPPAADGTVARNARILVQFDDWPDPDGVYFGPVQLLSGRSTFDIKLAVDFVGRTVVMTPRTPLEPGATYQVAVAAGFQALDGRVLADDLVVPIVAGSDLATLPAPPPTPTWNADIGPILGGCAPFCHSPVGASGDLRTPTRSLDLTGDPRDPRFGLVDVPSLGLLGTTQPLLRVAPGDPARSVLLRKLIGGNPDADSRDPPYPNLRVDGRRMPIPLDETQPADAPLDDTTLRLIQDWIAGGAPID